MDHITPVTLGSSEGGARKLTGHTERLKLQDVHGVEQTKEYTQKRMKVLLDVVEISRVHILGTRLITMVVYYKTCGGPSGR